MAKPIKWLLYAFGTLFSFLLLVVVVARLYVGSIDVQSLLSLADLLPPPGVAKNIKVPPGFSIGVYAEGLGSPRVLRFSRRGDLLFSNPQQNRVEILTRDYNDDYKADGRRILIDDLNSPNGLDFYGEWLYIAESDSIGRVRFNHAEGKLEGEYERIVTGLPDGGNHSKKTLRFGEDGRMYVTMGSSCNACIERDERRAAMVRYSADGSNETIIARGLRNSAGFDWSPVDGQIYATDNGRDMLGDDFPPCELNKIEEGKHFGWPFANGDKVPDPDFGDGNESIIRSSISPVFGFNAHNAPLGIEFVRSEKFPDTYWGAAIVALHGSWNRSEKDGYKVVSLHWDESGNITQKDFVSGLLVDGQAFGRPAEVTEGPDGAFYISDDYADVIYRVAFGEVQTEFELNAAKKFSAGETLATLSEQALQDFSGDGLRLYQQFQCVGCHQDSALGLKQLDGLGEKYDLETLSAYLKNPNAPMPLFPMDDEQRRAVSVYLIERYPGH